jgi:hypothetical protein
MEDQYQQPPPPPATQFTPEMVRSGSSQYSEAHYKFISTLIESESARKFFEQITATDFSHQCVNAFYKVLTSGFDKNAILAKNSKQEIKMRIIDFEIKLNLMVTECHESDITNPAFLTFRENILDTFKDFVSRSATERDQLLRSEYGIVQQENKPKQESSSIFSRGRE